MSEPEGQTRPDEEDPQTPGGDRRADDPRRQAEGTPAEGVVDPDEPNPVEPSEPG